MMLYLDLILSKVRKRQKDTVLEVITDTLQDGGTIVIYANSGGDPKKYLYIKEAIELISS